jgi:signal transduction histidine kinase
MEEIALRVRAHLSFGNLQGGSMLVQRIAGYRKRTIVPNGGRTGPACTHSSDPRRWEDDMFRRFRIADKILLAIVLPLLYQALLLGLLWGGQEEHKKAQRWAMHSKDVLLQMARAVELLTNAQSELREYALTRNEDSAKRVRQDLAQVGPRLHELIAATSDNTAQQQRLAKLEQDVNARVQWQNGVLQVFQQGHAEEAMNLIRQPKGPELMDQIRADVQAFRNAEAELDKERLEALESSTARQRLLLVSGLLLTVGVGLAAVLVLGRGINRRVNVLIENSRRVARGEKLVALMAGHDELNDLERNFHTMAAKLEQARETEIAYKQTLEQQNTELSRTNRDLDQKNQENEMFVYSVSHDLRSPLVNLQGFSKELGLVRKDLQEILSHDLNGQAQKRAQLLVERDMPESIQFIQTAVTRLSTIIDALLRLSRAGRVEYHPETVEVRPVVARIVAAMRGSIDEKKAEVAVGDLPSAWADPTALEQVFANLLANAVNYLDPSRPGRIEIGFLPNPKSGLDTVQLFYVKDNGLGIAEAYLPKVFAIFQRLHPSAAVGEGVGLTLVRRIVQRHGGEIWVESREGEGSTFFVALPSKGHSPLMVAPRKESIRLSASIPEL